MGPGRQNIPSCSPDIEYILTLNLSVTAATQDVPAAIAYSIIAHEYLTIRRNE